MGQAILPCHIKYYDFYRPEIKILQIDFQFIFMYNSIRINITHLKKQTYQLPYVVVGYVRIENESRCSFDHVTKYRQRKWIKFPEKYILNK